MAMKHVPVLEKEVLEQFDYLAGKKSGYFVDCTLGAGGHSLAMAKQFKIKNLKFKMLGIDKDQTAIGLAKDNIEKNGLYDNFILIQDDFNNIKDILAEQKIDNIDGALIDLGVSSMQLDNVERGFSFMDSEAELDMRMNQGQELNARTIVNHYSEEQLLSLLRDYGEEKFARKIARNICTYRKNRSIQTVGDLLWILEKSIPVKIQKTSKSHFATNTFRALRIEVNNELGDLAQTLKKLVELLNPGSRLAVITFHSTEDRIVKNTFRELSTDCICPPESPVCICDHEAEVRLVAKKPIIPSDFEIADNPRSRSAKLRVVEKI